LEAAQTLGANRRRLVTNVILPGILPNLYNDMRILLGWAWTYLIVAELIGASSGISWFINQQGKHFHFDNVFAGIMMIGFIGLICDQFLALFSTYLFPWLPNRRGTSVMTVLAGAFLFLPQRFLLQRARDKAADRAAQKSSGSLASAKPAGVATKPFPASIHEASAGGAIADVSIT
jgi:hypothetical protein